MVGAARNSTIMVKLIARLATHHQGVITRVNAPSATTLMVGAARNSTIMVKLIARLATHHQGIISRANALNVTARTTGMLNSAMPD
jgi:hypothetical protein